MRTLTFAKRCAKEILRDPLTLAFGLGFPVVLLLLLSAIQANIPVALFEIQHLAPGITVFGYSFMTLFSATLISKDRGSALFQRLYTTPLKAKDFILGYTLPIIPVCLLQTVATFVVAFALGLPITLNVLWACVFSIPVGLFYVSMGLLFGSVLGEKQVGGVCGALLTNLSAWLSGIWFDLNLVGGAFLSVANFLPFSHAVDMMRAVALGDFVNAFPHLVWVIGYTVVIFVLAIYLFLRQMKKQ